jgi:hypothetical protein
MVAAHHPHDAELLGVGVALQAARIRRGASLGEVEQHTCIRRANLELIEEERFDELPGDVYAAGFVRTYAEFLDLDADSLVDAFWRGRPPDPDPLGHHHRDAVSLRTDRRRLVPFAIAGLVLAAAAVVAAVLLLRREETPAPVAPPSTPVPKRVAATPKPLVLRAARGDSWVVVRFAGPQGKLVWQGTLRRGHMLRFGLRRRLWVGLGRPTAVTAHVGTKTVRLNPDRSRYRFG